VYNYTNEYKNVPILPCMLTLQLDSLLTDQAGLVYTLSPGGTYVLGYTYKQGVAV